jgi:hypothetical protein
MLGSLDGRPTIYFILMAMLSAIVVIQVLACSQEMERSKYVVSLLLEILAISLSLRLSQLLVFPSLIGIDPFWHAQFINLIIESGHVPTGTGYTSFPLMHIATALLSIISGIPNLKATFFLAVGLFEAFGPVIIYKLGCLVSDTRIGLLAALFLALADQNSIWGAQLIAMSLGLGFFSLIFLLMFLGDREIIFVLIFLFGATILTHTISSFVVLVFLVSVFLTRAVFSSHESKHQSPKVSGALIALYSLMLLSYWIYATDFFRYSVLELESTFANISFLSTPVGSTQGDRTQMEHDVDQIGMYIMYTLAAMGSLVWLSKEDRNSRAIILTGVAASFLAICYGFVFLSSRAIVPERWLAFAYLPLAVLAARGLLFVSQFAGTRAASVVTLLLIITYSFFMITNTAVNMDHPFFVKAVPRLGYHQSEITAASSLIDFMKGQVIFTDELYADAIFARPWQDADRIKTFSINDIANPNDITDTVVLRKEAYGGLILVSIEGMPFSYSFLSVDRHFESALITSRNRVFDNSDVKAYSP